MALAPALPRRCFLATVFGRSEIGTGVPRRFPNRVGASVQRGRIGVVVA